jgi:16S rRNA U516 pseudouridylate synthase RsuA-like enzyme
MPERLHKLLAQHGFGSRREIEKWILEGRVVLNGRAAQPGASYSSGDRVAIDGRDITSRLKVSAAAPSVLLYNKPQGQPITAAGEGTEAGKSVMESLPSVRGARWLIVNTMQAGDSGLMLLTSDGRLADALRRRAETIPAAYVARVLVPTPEFDVEKLPRVVNYDEETIEFESIEPRASARRRACTVREPRVASESRDPGAVCGHRVAARPATRPTPRAVARSGRSAVRACRAGTAASGGAGKRQACAPATPGS